MDKKEDNKGSEEIQVTGLVSSFPVALLDPPIKMNESVSIMKIKNTHYHGHDLDLLKRFWFWEFCGIVILIMFIVMPLIGGQPINRWIPSTLNFISVIGNTPIIVFLGLVYLSRNIIQFRNNKKTKMDRDSYICHHCGRLVLKGELS